MTPPAPAPDPVPGPAWTKADIVAWLRGKGVTLEKKALDQLSKAELLALVADLLDMDT